MSALVKYYGFIPYLLYDGTNGADFVATFNSVYPDYTAGCVASLTSQSGGVAVVHFTNIFYVGSGITRDLTLNAGDCVSIVNDPSKTPSSGLDLTGTRLGGIAASVKYGGFGQAVLGVLAVGNNNVAVTIKPAQPDTGYVANAFLDGPALALGSVSMGTPVKTSASVVTVPVNNSGLLPVTLSTSLISVSVTAPQS